MIIVQHETSMENEREERGGGEGSIRPYPCKGMERFGVPWSRLRKKPDRLYAQAMKTYDGNHANRGQTKSVFITTLGVCPYGDHEPPPATLVICS